MIDMERELRDVVSKLTACVAMRYATESNLQYIAETEKQQRGAWEAEFSSCAHPAVILPPGGVPRRRRNRVSSSDKNNDRNEAKSTIDLGVLSFSSDAANSESQHARQQQQQRQHNQQQQSLYQDKGPEEPHNKQNLMGSAKFLFACNPALEHRFKPSSSNLIGARDARSDPARGGTNDRNITRWGSERAVFKGSFSPYKLDEVPQQQLQELGHGHGFYEIARSTPSTTADGPRRGTYVMGAPTNSRHHVIPPTTGGALGTRDGALRRSTWLGPEVSPLRNEQDAARLNSPSPFSVKFAAAAWPSPKKNARRRGVNRGSNRGLNRGSNSRVAQSGSKRGGGPERGVRLQCRRGSSQQHPTCKGRTANIPPREVSDAQRPVYQASPGVELGAGPTFRDTCRDRRSSVHSNTISAAGCSSRGRLDTAGIVSVNTGEMPGSPPQWRNEACPRPFCVGYSSASTGEFADGKESTPAESRPWSGGTPKQRTKTDEPSPRQVDPHQTGLQGGTGLVSAVSRTKPAEGVSYSEQEQVLPTGGSLDPFRETGGTSAGLADHERKEAAMTVAGRADGGGKLVGEWGTIDYRPNEDASEGITTRDAGNAPNQPTAGDEDARSRAHACSILRPTSADAALVPSKSRSGRVAASPSSKAPIPFQFGTPELIGTVLAARGTIGARRQQQQQQRSQVPAEPRPHNQQTEPLVLVRQPSLQQRRNTSEDQDDGSECTISQEKHVMLLTKRLKQLVQLETITIQWERLPRREREKLDRQQHLIGSRFRVTEQLRRDSGFDVCVVPSVDGASFGTATVQSGGRGRRSTSNGANISHHSAKSSQGGFLPPSDAAISSSIDRPQAGTEVAGVQDGVAAADVREKEGARVEAGSAGVAAGKVAPAQVVSRTGKALVGGATPRGQRRRRGKRGGMACGVQDADIASGLAR